MKKGNMRIFACIMAGLMAGTSITPYMPPVSVYAAAQQLVDGWVFSGNGSQIENGIRLQGEGDNFGISDVVKQDNYTVKATLKQGEGDGAVGIVLGTKEADNPKEGAVVVNVTPSSGAVRAFCFQGGIAGDIHAGKTFEELKNQETYQFDVSVEDRQLQVKINDTEVYDFEISDTILEGNIGFIGFNEDLTITDITVDDIEVKEAEAYLSDLEVKGGELDKDFSKEYDSYSVVVKNETESISLIPTVEGSGNVTVNGEAAQAGKATKVDLKVGSQQIPVVVTSENGGKEKTIINVLRNASDSVYNVPTRPQYHYSPATGWANDPNGLVYYKGEYHLFYQYYPDDTVWGPMHWAHAVSKDLKTWEELPIALYYQEDMGAIFSGSCVVDDENKSGLFGDEKGPGTGGLVAIYTQNNDGRGQDQAIAYSKDKGRTWTKYKGNAVLKWNEDPLDNTAFRDPKVFYHEESGKYMMVVAGGILRIYSSDNLIDWEVESTYSGDEGNTRIETECPDMYPLTAEDGTTKWVVSEGGRYYRVGDFKQVDGKWTFVQDEGSDRYVMNFGPQSYAAMTYDNFPEGRRVMINWASTWENGYCNNVSNVTGKWGYNGFFNLQTELNLTKTENGYRLVQTPIKEYEDLRVKEAATNVKATIPKKTDSSENLLSGIKAGQYEIVAELTPKEGTTEVGFKLRTNDEGTKETIVKYNTETKQVSINGDKAGVIPEGQRKGDIVSDAIAVEEDGKVKLDIFVDESSVEVYAQDGQQSGTLAIFPSVNSTGMEVYSEGGETDADITVYPMKSIWEDKLTDDNTAADLYISTASGSGEYGVGDEIEVMAAISPVSAEQKVTWKVTNNKGDKVKVIKEKNDSLLLKALKKGVFTVTAETESGLSRSLDISITSSKLNSNIGDWHVVSGDWTLDENGYTGDLIGKGDGFLMSGTKISSDDYTFEADVLYHSGTAFAMIFRGQDPNSNKGYAANVDDPFHEGDGTSRIFTFGGGTGDIGNRVKYTLQPNNRYHLKVEVKGNHYKFYINDSLILDRIDRNANKNYAEGRYVGFNAFDAKVTYQNIKVTPMDTKEPAVDEKLSLYTGQSKTINVTMEEDDYNIVKYQSSNTDVAVIDDEGKVTAKKAGTAVIKTDVTNFGRKYQLETKVTVKAPYVKVTAPTTAYVGKTEKLSAKGYGVSGKVTWVSSNKQVATVSKSGVLSPKKAGTVDITAKIGNCSKKVKVVVKKPYIKATSVKSTVSRNKTYKFKATAYGTGKKVSWSLSKASKKYATMSATGTLKTKNKKATITVYAKSGKVTKAFKVKIK